jgi:hypothetical protein
MVAVGAEQPVVRAAHYHRDAALPAWDQDGGGKERVNALNVGQIDRKTVEQLAHLAPIAQTVEGRKERIYLCA